MLLTRGATVRAFDVNPAMVAVAREKVKIKDLKNKLTISEVGVERMESCYPTNRKTVLTSFTTLPVITRYWSPRLRL
jgi:hypothetical protein